MTRRAYAKRGPSPHDALNKDPLQGVLTTCNESLQGKRDRALLLFAWASGRRRRSEVGGESSRQATGVACRAARLFNRAEARYPGSMRRWCRSSGQFPARLHAPCSTIGKIMGKSDFSSCTGSALVNR